MTTSDVHLRLSVSLTVSEHVRLSPPARSPPGHPPSAARTLAAYPHAMETLFGKRRNRPRQSSIVAQDAADRSRPLSGASIATSRSESARGSRYAPSISPFEPHHHHLSNLYKHSPSEEFSFPRPENDEEIEMLFENIMRMRGLDDIPHLSIDQKWHIVYNDEHMRWGEERRREEQARKQTDSGQAAAPFSEGTPEWYIKKFMDRTITPKQASSLQVSLRSKEMRSVSSALLTRSLSHSLQSAGSATSSRSREPPYSARPSRASAGRACRGALQSP